MMPRRMMYRYLGYFQDCSNQLSISGSNHVAMRFQSLLKILQQRGVFWKARWGRTINWLHMSKKSNSSNYLKSTVKKKSIDLPFLLVGLCLSVGSWSLLTFDVPCSVGWVTRNLGFSLGVKNGTFGDVWTWSSMKNGSCKYRKLWCYSFPEVEKSHNLFLVKPMQSTSRSNISPLDHQF